jgi:superkiller protein 3
MRRGEYDLAQADIASALKIDPGGIEPNLLPGDQSYYQKDYEAAIKVYTQVTISHPESPNPYSRRADALFQQGKIDEAKADYGRAIGFDSTYAEASSNLAALLNSTKEYQDACAHARHAVQLDVDHPLFYARYGECLLWGARDIEGAQAAYDKAIQLNSNVDYAHIGLGDILYLQGKYSQAVTQYNLAVQLGTSRREHLLSQRGLAYTHLHSYQAAVNDFTNQININKTQCALVNRCQAYNGTGAFSAAIADCVAAINITGSLPAVFNLAVAYDESGQTEKALENYKAYLLFAEEGSEAASYAQARIDALTVTPLALACSAPASGICIEAKVLPGELRLQGGFPHLTCEAG